MISTLLFVLFVRGVNKAFDDDISNSAQINVTFSTSPCKTGCYTIDR